MASTTNSGSITSYKIGSDNFTLTNLGTIGSSASSAVAASGSGDTVANAGTIRGTAFGISASLGINVTNSGAGAAIYGGTAGVYVTGEAGTIANAASIGGGTYGIALKAGGTVVNAGSISGSISVLLRDGGVLTNQSSGTIAGVAAVSDYGGSTVVNDGSILSSIAAAFHQGVDIGQNSLLINHTTGIITGYFGVALDGASTVVNYGTIVGGEKGVQLFEGGTLTNQSGGTISANIFGVWATGPATVVNAGSIAGNENGVYLSQSYLANQITGVISDGVRLTDGATLLNAGRIGGSSDGVYLSGGNVLTNQSGGTISGSNGVEVSSAAVSGTGTVVNDGSIAGSNRGVELLLSGTLVNQADGTISGGAGAGVAILGVPILYTNDTTGLTYPIGYQTGRGAMTNAGRISGQYGVEVRNSFATVTNSGTIAGSTDAIVFASGYADRLVLYPGASIVGGVIGSGGVLELASAASAGTLDSLGSQFAGFAQVFVDTGADWVFNGTDTFIAGSTLTTAGTLDGSGGNSVSFASGAGNRVVVDPGAAFVGPVDGGNPIGGEYASVLELASTGSTGTLSGLGTQFIDFSQVIVEAGASWDLSGETFAAGMTLTNAGTIGDSVAFDPGAGNRVVVDPTGVFLGTLDGGNPIGSTTTSVLELAGGASAATLSGLGTQINDFGQVTVDAGASWYLTSDSFAAGMTLTNAGTVSGPGGTAAVFGPGAGNRVAIDQGGTFAGTVDGGNPIGSGTASVLELAGGSAYRRAVGRRHAVHQLFADHRRCERLLDAERQQHDRARRDADQLRLARQQRHHHRQRHPGRRHDPEPGWRHHHRGDHGRDGRWRRQQCRHHRRSGLACRRLRQPGVPLSRCGVRRHRQRRRASQRAAIGRRRFERRDADRVRHKVSRLRRDPGQSVRNLEHRRQHPRRRYRADQRRHGRGARRTRCISPPGPATWSSSRKAARSAASSMAATRWGAPPPARWS